jgi:hypothetical protein
MDEFDELIPPPDKDGSLDLTHRNWVQLDAVLWTYGRDLLTLNIAFNNIESLPPELGDLPLLRDLDCSCNRLSSCPAEVRSMLQHLSSAPWASITLTIIVSLSLYSIHVIMC